MPRLWLFYRQSLLTFEISKCGNLNICKIIHVHSISGFSWTFLKSDMSTVVSLWKS